MIVRKVLDVLSLPVTAVYGNLSRVYNDYTLFLPYKKAEQSFEYVLVTELSFFARRRIEMLLPNCEGEEFICSCILNGKKVFATQSIATSQMIKLPDLTTKLISRSFIAKYPFGTIYVPKNTLITPSVRDENIIVKEFLPCESEKYAEVFGQPKKMNI